MEKLGTSHLSRPPLRTRWIQTWDLAHLAHIPTCESFWWSEAAVPYLFGNKDWFPRGQFHHWPGLSRDGLGMIQEHYIYCALYFYYYINSISGHQGIRSQKLGTPNLNIPGQLPATWMDLEIEWSFRQRWRNIYIPYMWTLKRNDTNELTKQKETHRLREQTYGCQGERWG